MAYGFKHPEDNKLSTENILRRVSEEALWSFYLGSHYKPGKLISAPYRKDKDPSFYLKVREDGRMRFKDFGRLDMSGDIFDYMQAVFKLDFRDALEKVNTDFSLCLSGIPETGKERSKNKKISQLDTSVNENNLLDNKLQIIVTPFRQIDLDWWGQYGITPETLKLYNVYKAGKVFLNNVQIYVDYDRNPCYTYHFPITDHLKCYFPMATGKNKRFLSNVNNLQDVQGYYQCRVKEGQKDLLILTKSMKDCMLLRELGYDAMSINGEEHRFYDDFIRHIRKYYPIIISIYDPDKAGIKGARYIWREYKVLPYFIPKTYRKEKAKDVTDVYKVWGREIIEGILEGIIVNAKKIKHGIKRD